MRMEVLSEGPNHTKKIARALAANLKGGETIELIGDLGSGKTTFVGGLAEGLGVKEIVTSPTFKLENQYQGRLKIHHLDLYRIAEPGLIAHELEEVGGAPGTIVIIEWGKTLEAVLPKHKLDVRFVPQSENIRKLQFFCPSNLEYTLRNISW